MTEKQVEKMEEDILASPYTNSGLSWMFKLPRKQFKLEE